MNVNAILIDGKDNVVTVTEHVLEGEKIKWKDGTGVHEIPSGGVPVYHKAAIRNINEGEAIVKYGEIIANATQAIGAGMHVHVHNCHDPLK